MLNAQNVVSEDDSCVMIFVLILWNCEDNCCCVSIGTLRHVPSCLFRSKPPLNNSAMMSIHQLKSLSENARYFLTYLA